MAVSSVDPAVVSRDERYILVDDTHDAYAPLRFGPGLGDRLSVIPRSLGLADCGTCKKIRQALNAAGKLIGIG